MKIAIDISSIIYDRGVSRYTANLVRALSQLPEVHLHLYGSSFRQHTTLKKRARQLVKNSTNPAKIVIQQFPPTALALMWQLGLNPIRGIWPDIDVFHSWDWMQPPDSDLPLVSTIHDLAILEFPETAHPKILKKHQKSWELLKSKNAQIISISQATRADILKHLKIPANRINTVYEALPQENVQVAENLSEEKYERIKNKLGLNGSYILFVGTREPRKNLARLIEAWQPLAHKHQLIIAGEEGWDGTTTDQKKSPTTSSDTQTPQPRFLGKVTDQELVVLYSEADCFAYPSLAEGFGLPILEAFYFGTPTVTSNTSSMIEVAGNAAELVDPFKTENIRKGLKKILSETPPTQKQRLQKMILRLQIFNWKTTAQQTLAVYQKALNQFHDQK